MGSHKGRGVKPYPFKYISLNPRKISFPDDFPLPTQRRAKPGSPEAHTNTFVRYFEVLTKIDGLNDQAIEEHVSIALWETFLELGEEYIDTDSLCTDVATFGGEIVSRVLGEETAKIDFSLTGYICYALDRLIDAYRLSDMRRIWALHNDLAVAQSFLSSREELAAKQWELNQERSTKARKAAIARHSKPGGSHEKQRKIREAWASGKYSTKDLCAEEEYAALEMSFSSARKALRGEPEPDRS